MKRLPARGTILKATALAVIVVLMAGGCGNLGVLVSRRIYPNLPVPEDSEPPRTHTVYLPSTQLSAVVGGRGGGISCSIPAPIKPLFFQSRDNRADINLRFRQACALHDLCYRHGWATYGYSQVDCDFALQKDAYRLCQLIFFKKAENATPSARDARDAMESCRDEARLVLLGVRLGGGGAFQSGRASTYYEYDPMPERADNYGIIRWIGDTKDTTSSGRGQFVHLLFLHGRVKFTSFPSIPSLLKVDEKYALDMESIPTPPQVVSGDGSDRLIAFARRTETNSEGRIFSIGRSDDQNLHAVKIGAFDPDSTVAWLSRAAKGDRIAYWHRNDQRITTCKISDKGCHSREDSGTTTPLTSDTYRTLQHPPLRGRFFGGTCHFYAVLRRGGDPKPANPLDDKKGIGFEKSSGVLFFNDPDENDASCTQWSGSTVMAAPEEIEPLGVVESSQRDALIGFASADPSRSKAAMSATLFHFEKPKSSASPTVISEAAALSLLDPVAGLPLTSDWIARPVSILRAGVLGDERAHLIFSRLCGGWAPESKNDDCPNMPKTPAAPTVSQPVVATPARTSSSGEAQVTQVEAVAADRAIPSLATVANQLAVTPIRLDVLDYALVCTPGKCVASFSSGVSCELAGRQATADSAERWANGDLMPGVFSKADVSPDTGRLQIAVFYRGHTDRAFVAPTYFAHSQARRERISFLRPPEPTEPELPGVSCGPYSG